jgi:hypothetical protein
VRGRCGSRMVVPEASHMDPRHWPENAVCP